MSCPGTGCSWATELITFSAEKFGTRYAAPVASQRTIPLVKPANPRRSSANVPITNKAKANTAESNGEENEENSSAKAVMIRNWRMMKYNATKTQPSAAWKWRETYNNAANTPSAMKNALTTSVPARPKNLPTINSQRWTGRDRTV